MTPDQVRGDGGAPLIVTAELPGDLKAWSERLRKLHYPVDRNRVEAHVTLFHALPPSCEAELCDVLAELARTQAPVPARLAGVMPLGRGTALSIVSPAMAALRGQIADRFGGVLLPQDLHEPRLHLTVQNKVSPLEAKALQNELSRTLAPRDFRFAGLALHRYRGGPWEPLKRWSFRG